MKVKAALNPIFSGIFVINTKFGWSQESQHQDRVISYFVSDLETIF